jgi:biotin-dependent carboxylase-like uncharacterized protein
MLKILQGGLETTVQDRGRYKWYRIGMPPAGAMDQFSFRVGNMLVGNPEDAAGLEITFQGPEVETDDDAILAVTGADISLRINGAPVPQWTAHYVAKGSKISCGPVQRGVRAYLCIAGGIDIPPRLGSRSTYMLGRFGGVEGRRLMANEQLPIGAWTANAEALVGRQIRRGLIPELEHETELRIVIGMCADRLLDESLDEFLSARWQVSTESNRVGYRLKGPRFKFKEREQPFGAGSDPSNVVDLGYPVGSIQVPGGQEAILLMRDAVTLGGYATIGTVIQCDLDRAAQAEPGSGLRFRAVDIESALRARAAYKARLARVADSLSLFDQVDLLGQ